jgi:type IV pilus assembly protein PilV
MSRQISSSERGRAAAGFTLIEVLLALVLFSVGILGMIALQGRATDFTTSAENSARAAKWANELATQMLAQQTVNTSTLGTVYTTWQSDVQADLPTGSGVATLDASGDTATITITWKDTQKQNNVQHSGKYITKVVVF